MIYDPSGASPEICKLCGGSELVCKKCGSQRDDCDCESFSPVFCECTGITHSESKIVVGTVVEMPVQKARPESMRRRPDGKLEPIPKRNVPSVPAFDALFAKAKEDGVEAVPAEEKPTTLPQALYLEADTLERSFGGIKSVPARPMLAIGFMRRAAELLLEWEREKEGIYKSKEKS